MSGSARPQTWDHLRSLKKPVTQKVQLALDSVLADEWSEAKNREAILAERVKDAQAPSPQLVRELEDARAVLDELRPQMEEATVAFTFRSLGRQRYEALMDQHKPTKEQEAEARKQGSAGQLQYNIDTFPIAIIAACCVEPDLTEDQVKEMWNSEEWNDSELASLFAAAMSVNSQRRIVDLGNG